VSYALLAAKLDVSSGPQVEVRSEPTDATAMPKPTPAQDGKDDAVEEEPAEAAADARYLHPSSTGDLDPPIGDPAVGRSPVGRSPVVLPAVVLPAVVLWWRIRR
jgi:hypothetical protein